jgi:hypothetical protein
MAGLTEDDLTRGWSLAPDDAAEVLRARGTQHRLRCAVQLCTLRATGRFVADYRHVPIEAVNPRQGLCRTGRGIPPHPSAYAANQWPGRALQRPHRQ